MPAPPEQVVRTYHDSLLNIRARAGLTVGTLWDRLAGLDEESLRAFAAAAALSSTAAQQQTVALFDAYLAVMLGGRPVGLSPGRVLEQVRNGVPAAEVYARPVVTARAAVSEGRPVVDALRAGRARAVSAAETDVVLAQRQAMVDEAVASRVAGWRRTLTGRSCALCATASTQRYRTSELMPIHSHCDCGVAPIVGDSDPGHIINRDIFADLKANGGSQYWKNRSIAVDEDGTIRHRRVVKVDGERREVLGDPLNVAVREHGELGPVLTDRAHDFAGPSAVAA